MEKDFEIEGEINNKWHIFEKGKNYDAFLVRLKKIMKTKKINTRKKPIVIIDKSLDFYNNISLFPEKVEKANQMLKNVGLPMFDEKGKLVS